MSMIFQDFINFNYFSRFGNHNFITFADIFWFFMIVGIPNIISRISSMPSPLTHFLSRFSRGIRTLLNIKMPLSTPCRPV